MINELNFKKIQNQFWRSLRGVVANVTGLQDRSNEVRTPVALLRSL